MAALTELPQRQAAFTEAPIEVFTSYRPDLTEGDPWLLGRGRVLVISVTRGSGSGTVFEAPDGTRFIFRAVATREEADAAAANAGADARVFAVRPAWSTHARAWVDADPQLWRASPSAASLTNSAQPHGSSGRVMQRGDMQQRTSNKTRFECANPILSVADMHRSVRYYVDVLGFQNAEWGGNEFTCVTRDNAGIYLSQGGQGHAGTWVWVGVEDVQALFEEYKAAGANILHAPENYPWAYEMKVADPDGHVLRFGSEPREDTPFAE
jgi:predicted enzyme related to lactoylglutathione lyase